MGWWPCDCCAAGGCDIFADDFNRGDSTSLGSDWTEVSGDWSISSSRLAADNEGIAIANDAHPDSETAQIAQVDIYAGEDGESLGLVLNYVNEDNYHYIEVIYYTDPPNTTGTLRFWKVTSGTPAQLGSDRDINAEAGNWYTLKGCMTPTSIAASFDGAAPVGEATTAHATGYKAGVIVTNLEFESTVYFDDFDYDKHWSSTNTDCDTCPQGCGNCADETPALMKVVIAGVTGCSINGTYIVPHYVPYSGGNTCAWYELFVTSNYILVEIKTSDTSRVTRNPSSGNYVTWTYSYGATVNCMTIDTAFTYSAAGGSCAGGSSTCQVTAI